MAYEFYISGVSSLYQKPKDSKYYADMVKVSLFASKAEKEKAKADADIIKKSFDALNKWSAPTDSANRLYGFANAIVQEFYQPLEPDTSKWNPNLKNSVANLVHTYDGMISPLIPQPPPPDPDRQDKRAEIYACYGMGVNPANASCDINNYSVALREYNLQLAANALCNGHFNEDIAAQFRMSLKTIDYCYIVAVANLYPHVPQHSDGSNSCGYAMIYNSMGSDTPAWKLTGANLNAFVDNNYDWRHIGGNNNNNNDNSHNHSGSGDWDPHFQPGE